MSQDADLSFPNAPHRVWMLAYAHPSTRTSLVKYTLGLTSLLTSLLLIACGPSVGGNGDGDGDGDGDGTPDAGDNTSFPDSGPCLPSAEGTTPATCDDGQDNDCDDKWDCQDPDCSGIGDCPVCGEVNTSAGSGIVLPDGIIGNACTTDAQCTDPNLPNCVESECHASYTSTLDVIGFGPNQTFDSVDIIQSVCVTMEHSWLRDLEMRLIAPGGQIVRLQKFLGRVGGEVYMGQANDCDEGSPSPGTGAMYCWKPTATNVPMLDYANNGTGMGSSPTCYSFTAVELPPGDYAAADPWTQLNGTSLNGQWKFVVTDLWPIDNGFIFDWSISFDPNLVTDCGVPPIG